MFLWIDYVLFSLPGILVTAWAQAQILRAYAAGSRIPAASELTGAEIAQIVMSDGGATGVKIEAAAGELSDHFDAPHKLLRLSRGVCEGRSLAALGVAAHEAGHAIQDASGYPGLVVRNIIVPWTGLGSQIWGILIAAGLWLGMERLILLGIILFSLMVILQLLNLPVERDASRRGREVLVSAGLVNLEEEPSLARVLNAAAWTYVAATLTGVLGPWVSRAQWSVASGQWRQKGRYETDTPR
jgi:Zn-dependent membrane protease YugP